MGFLLRNLKRISTELKQKDKLSDQLPSIYVTDTYEEGVVNKVHVLLKILAILAYTIAGSLILILIDMGIATIISNDSYTIF
jgi:hypothetical protein